MNKNIPSHLKYYGKLFLWLSVLAINIFVVWILGSNFLKLNDKNVIFVAAINLLLMCFAVFSCFKQIRQQSKK